MLFLVVGMFVSRLIQPPINISASEAGYTIESFDVDIQVGEDNVLTVSEQILVNFDIPSHGIYRYIPTKQQIIRQDGSSSNRKSVVSGIAVEYYRVANSDVKYKHYDITNEFDKKVIVIGSQDIELSGMFTYNISYTYDLGIDLLDGADEFYFNLVGLGWTCDIDNLSFSITMPKSFDSSKLGFVWGRVDDDFTNGVTSSVDGLTISGSFAYTLPAGNAFTMRIELSDGYFVGATDFYSLTLTTYHIVLLSSALVAIVVATFLIIKFLRERKVLAVVEIGPPDDLNSLEVAYKYKLTSDAKDVMSLLVYLASKGYLAIEEDGENGKNYTLTKTKNYIGADPHIKKFLTGLFGKDDQAKITNKQLKSSFYTTVESIGWSVKAQCRKEKLNTTISAKRQILPIVLSVALVVFGLLWGDIVEGMYFVLPIVIGFVLNFFVSKFLMHRLPRVNLAINVLISIFVILSGIAAYQLVFLPADALTKLICAIAIYVNIIAALLVPVRTKENKIMQGRIAGFKDYLTKVEKAKLEQLVNDDPTYFYDILPYAYVLGVADTWIKKFEDISMPQPVWYHTTSTSYLALYMLMNAQT